MAENTETEIPAPAFVLLEWTGLGAKHLATDAGNAFLIPRSITRVATPIWEIARPWHTDLIVPAGEILSDKDKELGRIIEHSVTVAVENVPERKGPGGTVTAPARRSTKVTAAKDLKDLSDSEARTLLTKIVDPVTLEGYLKDPELDGLPSLKGAIERRLKEVQEKGSKKAGG